MGGCYNEIGELRDEERGRRWREKIRTGRREGKGKKAGGTFECYWFSNFILTGELSVIPNNLAT